MESRADCPVEMESRCVSDCPGDSFITDALGNSVCVPHVVDITVGETARPPSIDFGPDPDHPCRFIRLGQVELVTLQRMCMELYRLRLMELIDDATGGAILPRDVLRNVILQDYLSIDTMCLEMATLAAKS